MRVSVPSLLRSAMKILVSACLLISFTYASTACNFCMLLDTRTILKPAFANLRVISYPMPAVHPVTTAQGFPSFSGLNFYLMSPPLMKKPFLMDWCMW